MTYHFVKIAHFSIFSKRINKLTNSSVVRSRFTAFCAVRRGGLDEVWKNLKRRKEGKIIEFWWILPPGSVPPYIPARGGQRGGEWSAGSSLESERQFRGGNCTLQSCAHYGKHCGIYRHWIALTCFPHARVLGL